MDTDVDVFVVDVVVIVVKVVDSDAAGDDIYAQAAAYCSMQCIAYCSILHAVSEYIGLRLIKSLHQTWGSPPLKIS